MLITHGGFEKKKGTRRRTNIIMGKGQNAMEDNVIQPIVRQLN